MWVENPISEDCFVPTFLDADKKLIGYRAHE